MRRLSLKKKGKNLEIKITSSKSKVKKVADENISSVEYSAVNKNSAKGSKSRRSRGQADNEGSGHPVKYGEISEDSENSITENTTLALRLKRGRGGTTVLKTEENRDSLDSAVESSAKRLKSTRNQNETIKKQRTRSGGDEPVKRQVTSSNWKVKEVSDENVSSVESSAVNKNSAKGSKSRRSRGQADNEGSGHPVKYGEISEDSENSITENTTLALRLKIGRGCTTVYKTEENGVSLDSAVKSSAKRLKSTRSQNETIKNQRTRSDGDEPVKRQVESILATRKIRNQRQYRVHWKGQTDEEDTWVNENKLSSSEMLQDFLRKQEKKKLQKQIKVGGGSKEYEVERIIDVRIKKGGKREFLIHWKGFSPNEDTWEPENNLNCPDLFTKFMKEAKNPPSRGLRSNPVLMKRH